MTPARHMPAAAPPETHVSASEILRLTFPQLLMMCFQLLVGLTDVWVAGKIHRDVQAVRLPLAFVSGHIIWQASEGVFMGMFISQLLQASVMLYIFQTRDWARFAMIRRHAHA